jgi:hypothetical protein
MTFDELQADMPQLVQDCRDLLADLEAAESCESFDDFFENMKAAVEKIASVKLEAWNVFKDAKKLAKKEAAQ